MVVVVDRFWCCTAIGIVASSTHAALPDTNPLMLSKRLRFVYDVLKLCRDAISEMVRSVFSPMTLTGEPMSTSSDGLPLSNLVHNFGLVVLRICLSLKGESVVFALLCRLYRCVGKCSLSVEGLLC